jgi:hypothetical protein
MVHGILRLGAEELPDIASIDGHATPERLPLTLVRPFLAVYGAGIGGTFAWLFFTLSGLSVCAASRESCQTVIGLTGQLALTWPAYWGERLAGEPLMVATLPFKVVITSVVVFVVVLVLSRIHALLERPEIEAANGLPLIPSFEPNRRNQSAIPPLV